MKKRILIVSLLLAFGAEILALLFLAAEDHMEDTWDTVLVNEAVQSIQADWDTMTGYQDHTGLDYVVLDRNGAVLFRTREELSESIHEAVSHRDTILDIQADGSVVGKVIIYNDSIQAYEVRKQAAMTILACVMFAQCLICILYVFYLERTVIRPFRKLKGFAERIAGGCLDVPLEMDRGNLFGAFTESFDIMRSELKKARMAEAEANAGKKELVAKLSHDIKTPVASIKAASEVGSALTDNEKIRENYTQIIRKADQIDSLITNLFTATLEELPLLKEKFRRGKNAGNKEGAGLGLYISDYFMREMGGKLVVENGESGLRVTVGIALSGVI